MTSTTASNRSDAANSEIPTPIGAPLGGGFYAGRYQIDGVEYALIVAPKDGGDHDDSVWNDTYKTVEGARSYGDGLANTKAMAEAGSELAKWALELDIDGATDWYIPSLDEQEILYRAFKPTIDKNYCWARSGINLNALPATHPYTPSLPTQTAVEAFRADGAQAFEAAWYWTSTQHAADSDYAWNQYFGDGGQDDWGKNDTCRARAVRKIKI